VAGKPAHPASADRDGSSAPSYRLPAYETRKKHLAALGYVD
jgi:hypothetical protein